jgi:hypothetical protein
MAQFSSAFEQIMGDTAVDDLSGYAVETVGRSARAASLGNISLDATAPAIAPIVTITPAVLTPPPTSIGNTTSGLSSIYSSIADATFSPAFTVKGNDYE